MAGLLASTALAADGVGAPECANGICAFAVDAALATAPCAGVPLFVAYAETGGVTLLQCGRASDGAGNRSLVYDRRNPEGAVYELTGTRVVGAAALPAFAASGVADIVANKPLCVKPRPPVVPSGQLLLLARAPSDTAGACYRVLRADTDVAGAVVRADDRLAPVPTPAARAAWRALVTRANGWLPGATARADAAASPTARSATGVSLAPGTPATAPVRAVQAYLYELPFPGIPSHTYLDQGETVTILDTTRDPAWVKIRYVGKAGRPIERWVHAEDLDLARPGATGARQSR